MFDILSFQPPLLETVLKQIVHDSFVIRQSHDAVADIPRRHTEKLSFAKIAENSDIVITPRSLRTLRTNTERILNELKAEREIIGFTTYKKGRAIDGVTITV